MKTTVMITALVFSVTAASAQSEKDKKVKEADVPKAVVTAFHENFKNATVKEWEKEANGNYEVEYKSSEHEGAAVFTANGVLMESEKEIALTLLPKASTDYIAKNYAGYKMDEALQITKPSGEVSYEVEVKKGKEEFDLLFDNNGAFLKKEAKD